MNDSRMEAGSARIDIHPAPSNEEVAAIVAVVRAVQRVQPDVVAVPHRSNWQIAARREAVRLELTHEVAGWGRAARLGN